MTKTKTRSSPRGMKPATQPPGPAADGVGGRQTDTHPQPGGGGYQDVCTGQESAGTRDPRLAELRQLSIRRVWVRIAERIGFDAFLNMWEILDRAGSVKDEHQRVYVPSMNQYLRYQRNRFILSLRRSGATPKEIRDEVESTLGTSISLTQVKYVLKRGERGG